MYTGLGLPSYLDYILLWPVWVIIKNFSTTGGGTEGLHLCLYVSSVYVNIKLR
jgi:hypothetical protein